MLSLFLLAGLFGSDAGVDEKALEDLHADAEIIRHKLDIQGLL